MLKRTQRRVKLKRVFGMLNVMLLILIPYTASASLVAHYQLDGNANDSSGNGNNGLVYGATPTVDRNGNANSAYSFDGNDYINIPNTAPFELTEEITISAWARVTVDTGSINQRIISFGPAVTYGFELFLWSASDERMTFNYGDWFLQADVPVVYNEWQMITAVATSSEHKIYINGELAGSVTHTPTGFSYAGELNIGRLGQYNGKWDYWHGQIDDIRIYSHALTASEVSALASVPIPSAIWLLGSAFIGFVGFRKKIWKA